MQEIKVERTHLFAPNISVVIKAEISGALCPKKCNRTRRAGIF